MAKRGAPVGWAAALRADLAVQRSLAKQRRDKLDDQEEQLKFWQGLYQQEIDHNTKLYDRLLGFNRLSTWKKVVFVVKGGHI